MSAWIVGKAHIDLLVEAFFKYEIPTTQPLTPDELGTLWWRENHRSVNYRYSERSRTPRYRHENMRVIYGDHPLTALGTAKELARHGHLLFKQLACFRYQTCEHPAWERSQACAYLTKLEEAICKSLGMTPETIYEAPEWDQAPWGIHY